MLNDMLWKYIVEILDNPNSAQPTDSLPPPPSTFQLLNFSMISMIQSERKSRGGWMSLFLRFQTSWNCTADWNRARNLYIRNHSNEMAKGLHKTKACFSRSIIITYIIVLFMINYIRFINNQKFCKSIICISII